MNDDDRDFLRAQLVKALGFAIETAITIDKHHPAGEIPAESIGPCPSCGYRVKRSDATGQLADYMEDIHRRVEHLIPERCRWFVRALLVHLEDEAHAIRKANQAHRN